MQRSHSRASLAEKRVRLIATQGRARARLVGVLAETCAGRSACSWPIRLMAAIEAGIEFAATSPEEARLLLLDAVAIDPALGAGALHTHDYLADLLRSGRDHCPSAAKMPELTERTLIGAATSLVGTKLIKGEASDLRSVGPPLALLLLTPYVGPERARQLSLGE